MDSINTSVRAGAIATNNNNSEEMSQENNERDTRNGAEACMEEEPIRPNECEIVGASKIGQEIVYRIRRRGVQVVTLMNSSEARARFPQLVIKFYEKYHIPIPGDVQDELNCALMRCTVSGGTVDDGGGGQQGETSSMQKD